MVEVFLFLLDRESVRLGIIVGRGREMTDGGVIRPILLRQHRPAQRAYPGHGIAESSVADEAVPSAPIITKGYERVVEKHTC